MGEQESVTVGVLAMPRLYALDVAIPVHMLGRLPAYRVLVCGDPRDAAPAGIAVTHTLRDAAEADILVVPGYGEPYLPVDDRHREVLRAAHARGARIVGICTGVFALADAGLLAGRTAAVHWHYADLLREAFPDVEVAGNRLLAVDGRILTSAGAAAGIDTCLYLIEADLGTVAADEAAREVVVPSARAAGEAQYSTAAPHSRRDLRATLAWADERLGEPLTVAALAEHGRMSRRTLIRHFTRETGLPPMRWVTLRRITAARRLLESTDRTVEAIAAETGFGSPVNFRTIFRREVGVNPGAYRRLRGPDGERAVEDPR
ncbi:GlxA family transcriptional regulator [Nocardiopsis flavescens]|uniref:Transcriptional regulator GlxA family, contains an amidase domain and an AraC-type DNA-binding HTH domain n=1 Tax=Nocardiopsis flavescens TaxID=758803 RepID=A0A1M6L5D5_9ACTN|nr:helix-turn-helix domain-containing protein [Nocardiopsis flavescens]SHJ66406.1 Transcriptional regulator GlxA family, contains an amidase domain and an AraC-type DNA-binding HTH domain [Nocardiopsis flavescens]